MRDSNHRSVVLNRSSITITSAVYDRRALDCNSEIPLINSLNHLTYLTSNSAKVRETVASDGALVRLVSILHDCYIAVQELSSVQLRYSLTPVEKVARERKLAMVAWKWTLAFQCLVLTGTRGTEQIRKEVVYSGVIPILATVLDNYLIFEKNYDFLQDKTIEFDFKKFNYTENPLMSEFFKDDNQLRQLCELYKTLVKDEPSEGIIACGDNLCEPNIMRLSTTFNELWNTSMSRNGRKELESDNYDNIVVSIPRSFFMGKIIPKADDVTWSLQLLAFISKYTYMKPHLQKVQLVESLSLRVVLTNIRMKQEQGLDMTPLRISDAGGLQEDEDDIEELNEPDDIMIDRDDPFLIEIESLCGALKSVDFPKRCKDQPIVDFTGHGKPLSRKERFLNLKGAFEKQCNYDTVVKTLNSETWDHIMNMKFLNLFPLVERFTVKRENERDMTYWSSVIMRNSCRKNETTGVRQCANFACGKWEDYPKQFAKCRRCKRTKYCSRECQLHSWNYHRYWCQEVGSSSMGASSTANGTGTNTPNDGVAGTESTTTTGTPTTDNGRSILSTAETVGEPQRIRNTATRVNEEDDGNGI